MKELIMSRDELPVLTNDIYSGDKRYFKAVYPFYGTSLFSVDFDRPEITNIVDRETFNSDRRVRTPKGMDIKELVQHDNLKDCLLSSGFLRFENEDAVIGWLRKKKDESTNPSERQRFLFVALDTNIMYYRFISRHLSFRDVDGRPFHDGLRYMVSDIVREEIDNKVYHKHNQDDIAAFRSTFNRQELVNELSNGSDLRGRTAKLAFNECEFVRMHLKASRASGKGSSDKEENDRAMTKSYMDRAMIGNHEACLLSADKDMVHHARTCDMTAMQVVLPPDVPKHLRASPWSLCNLIYDLSVTFGAFSLENKEEITILGEWRHKASDDYMKERVKVIFSDDSRYSSVASELERCRSALNIINERD